MLISHAIGRARLTCKLLGIQKLFMVEQLLAKNPQYSYIDVMYFKGIVVNLSCMHCAPNREKACISSFCSERIQYHNFIIPEYLKSM